MSSIVMSESFEFPNTAPTTPPTILLPWIEIATSVSSSSLASTGFSVKPTRRESITVPASVPTMLALPL